DHRFLCRAAAEEERQQFLGGERLRAEGPEPLAGPLVRRQVADHHRVLHGGGRGWFGFRHSAAGRPRVSGRRSFGSRQFIFHAARGNSSATTHWFQPSLPLIEIVYVANRWKMAIPAQRISTV